MKMQVGNSIAVDKILPMITMAKLYLQRNAFFPLKFTKQSPLFEVKQVQMLKRMMD